MISKMRPHPEVVSAAAPRAVMHRCYDAGL